MQELTEEERIEIRARVSPIEYETWYVGVVVSNGEDLYFVTTDKDGQAFDDTVIVRDIKNSLHAVMIANSHNDLIRLIDSDEMRSRKIQSYESQITLLQAQLEQYKTENDTLMMSVKVE